MQLQKNFFSTNFLSQFIDKYMYEKRKTIFLYRTTTSWDIANLVSEP